MSCQIAKTEYWKIMIWLSDTKCCHLAIHYVLPKVRPGPNLRFRFMKNCIHTSLLGSLEGMQHLNMLQIQENGISELKCKAALWGPYCTEQCSDHKHSKKRSLNYPKSNIKDFVTQKQPTTGLYHKYFGYGGKLAQLCKFFHAKTAKPTCHS